MRCGPGSATGDAQLACKRLSVFDGNSRHAHSPCDSHPIDCRAVKLRQCHGNRPGDETHARARYDRQRVYCRLERTQIVC